MKPFEPDTTRLARAMLNGPFTEEQLLRRGRPLIKGNTKWFDRLVNLALARFGNLRPRQRELVKFLLTESFYSEADDSDEFEVESSFDATEFVPEANLQHACTVMEWNTVSDLADWLGLRQNELNWFADRKQLQRFAADEPLRHYRYHWVRKRHGRCRLIEAPKPRLREIQRRLLRSVFEHIACHDAAHGFRRSRSTKTHAAPHVGKQVVLRMDLQEFFPSIRPSRLSRLLMHAGYPEEVAEFITALCCNYTHADAWKYWPHPDDLQQRRETQRHFQRAHFPQGAPTSPAIANLCAFRLDCRLTGLARWAEAAYTRYADDLLFSGDESFRRKVDRFRIFVAAIVMEEGFVVNHRKTSVMPRSARQFATGLVINEKLNTPRDDFDRLKAILHQSVQHGPASQNRDSHPNFRNHLLGRIQYVGQWNAARFEKLMRMLNAIAWE